MITPLGKKVAVRRLPKRQEGVIIDPDIYSEPSKIGEIVALGTGAEKFIFSVRPGDKVLIPDMASRGEYMVDGEGLMIISEENLLGILDE